MVFALLIPAILDLGTSSVLGTTKLQTQRADVYTADGAMDGAIQYLRRHSECGRVFEGDCPIPPGCPVVNKPCFSFTANNKTAVVTWTARGIGGEFDRSIDLVSTEGGVQRVVAHVVISDSVGAIEPPVDVKTWRYNR